MNLYVKEELGQQIDLRLPIRAERFCWMACGRDHEDPYIQKRKATESEEHL